ncbi:MAG: DUF3316 domain-containing protein [Paramuribaculum sp.]|nr:DUF3316 domain-containing protein [Paramuribaculum sp.]
MKKSVLFLLVFLTFCVAGHAQTEEQILRPVTAAYTFGIGSSHLADTYLSPINYNGWSASFDYNRWQAMKASPESWLMNLNFGIEIDRGLNRVGNAVMWYAGFNASWGVLRRWNIVKGLKIGVGPIANIDLGALYLNRNSNNPVSAKAALTVGANGFAAYNLRIGRLPVTLLWQPTLPVVGAFFSPDYGELYYEIYLGNHNGLAHCAWWGNYFRLDNSVTADLHFGATALRIGYRGEILSTKVNHLVSNHFTHRFVIGISGEWLSLNPRKTLSPKAKTYHALYNF